MNHAHAHLLVNHLPIFSSAIAGLLLVFAYAWRARADAFRLSAVVLVLGAFSTTVALRTGEGAEDLVEPLPGVTSEAIHLHEAQAEAAGWFSIALGVAAAAATAIDRRNGGRTRRTLILVLLLGVIGGVIALTFAGHSGGMIRHPEMQPGFELKQAQTEEGAIEDL